jgi:hypothetical protein
MNDDDDDDDDDEDVFTVVSRRFYQLCLLTQIPLPQQNTNRACQKKPVCGSWQKRCCCFGMC